MKKQVARCLVLAVAAFLLGAAAHAQDVKWLSYAAKFACGNVGDESGAVGVDGRYFTTVNIHNPHYLVDVDLPIPVTFFKKIVLAQPQDTPPLPPSCHLQEFLEADFSLAVTCKNIKSQLARSGLPSAGFIEGFVVLQVPPFQSPNNAEPPELDVTALYTARTRAPSAEVRLNGISTWDVEAVDPKQVVGNPQIDLCAD